ncbi:MAG: metallophosphoesterase [Bacilli bacterium]|nr:metallophosphoesterase [Bacilli bacterium]
MKRLKYKILTLVLLFIISISIFPISRIIINAMNVENIQWESGSFYSASAEKFSSNSRIRTSNYLNIDSYSGVTINEDFCLIYFAFDEEHNYLGNGSPNKTANWLEAGKGILLEDVKELYLDASLFKLVIKRKDETPLSINDLDTTGIKFYTANEIPPIEKDLLENSFVMSTNSCQDGDIYNNHAFMLDASGNCNVYDISKNSKISSFELDKKDVLLPHANSVFFSNKFYDENDSYPLLYVNIYNNYSSANDRKEGVCCVYRIIDGVTLSSQLVQVIKIGFVEDLSLWKSLENNQDIRPYGNFVIDHDNDKLYSYVLRDKTNQTRFFEFDLPEISKGTYDENYGCNVITLQKEEIVSQFDVEYISIIQGTDYYDGKIYVTSGYGNNETPGYINVINLSSKNIVQQISLSNFNLTGEPEMIAYDEVTNKMYYSSSSGNIYKVNINPENINMYYDDHLDLSGKEVEIINQGTPTSYKVGYGLSNNELDDAVITLDGSTLIATGIGKATIKVDGVTKDINVTSAPISMILLAGQSNMQGSEGNENQSIVCETGQVYATYGDRYTMTTSNATNFAASALTGSLRDINVNGTTTNLSGYPIYSLNEEGKGKPGPDSGFAYEWIKATNEKVWIINAAHGGSSITTWQKGQSNYEEAKLLFKACQETMKKEVAAGHYTLSHMGYFWCQGCSDDTQTAEWYVNKYLTMHNSFLDEFSADLDNDPSTADNEFEFGNIVITLAGRQNDIGYRRGEYETDTSGFFMTYKDLELRGQRVAQYYLAASKEHPDINLVCNIGEKFVTMPDGSDGVKEYFDSHYENGTVDYKVQVAQSASWYKPTTPKAVKDTIHYNQIGYNEVGIEACRNTMYLLGYLDDPIDKPEVDFYNWTGFEKVSEIEASLGVQSSTLVVPIATPCYKAKEIDFEVSEGLIYNYFDLTVESASSSGTLKVKNAANDAEVKVNPLELSSYYYQFDNGELVDVVDENYSENSLTKLEGTTTDSIFANTRYKLEKPIYLLHNEEWELEFKGTLSGTFLFSNAAAANSGASFIYKSNSSTPLLAIGYYTGKEYHNYGIDLSKFSIDISKAHKYTLENRVYSDNTNMVYLFVDDELLGPMNNYHIAAVSQNATDNWVNGKDIIINYLGATGHKMTNVSFEYIKFNEKSDENETTNKYKEKVFSVMGDSVSTFKGYIPVADGFNLNHAVYYPTSAVGDVNQTWWMDLINEMDGKLGINESWSGSRVLNTLDGNSGNLGKDAAMASLTRIKNLGSNGTPDVILFFGGINDIAHGSPLGSFDSLSVSNEVDLTTYKWDSFADAYACAVSRMKYYYPEATIICLQPLRNKSYYNDETLNQYSEVIQSICDFYDVEYLSLFDKVDLTMLADVTHPNKVGMQAISDALIEKLNTIDIASGANIVHSVTHNLNGVKASLSYYKGISDENSFVEQLTSERDYKISVKQGNEDITSQVYEDGVINISSVKDDIVIEAIAEFDFGSYLKELPEKYCCDTNLLDYITLENGYYSGTTGEKIDKYYSIVIPVKEGEKILATSFKEAGFNNNAANGIRVNYFDAYGITKTLAPAETYQEYLSNGYLTVPSGAMYMNVVFWVSNNNELYILSAQHENEVKVFEPTCEEDGYTLTTCSICKKEVESDYKDALDHNYSLLVSVDSTCNEYGYSLYECDRCEELKKVDYISLGKHNYVDGTCSHCKDSVLSLKWTTEDLATGDYSMVVIPDTQILVERHPEVYYELIQWIIDNKETYNIQAVMHMGDIVNTNTNAQWEIAKQGLDKLNETDIAWMPMMGNHDNATYFNQYFDYQTYGENKPYFGGSYQDGKLDHTYWYVSVKNREYVILSLGWAPSYDVLVWAEEIILANQDKNIIINCHAYMNSDNTLLSNGDAHCPSSYIHGYPNGDDVWNTFKKYNNVVLALGGHISSPNIAKYVDTNGLNKEVHSLLVDNQNEDINTPYGLLLLLTFDKDSNNVNANWYSTKYDALYGKNNQFEFSVPHLMLQECKVQYYNGDSRYYHDTLESGSLLEFPDDPVPPEGYKFIGWFTEDDIEWNVYSDCIYTDVKLYAKYEKIVYPTYYEQFNVVEKSSEEKGPIISSTGEMIAGATTETYTYTYENIDVSSGKIKVSGRVGSNTNMHLIAFFDKQGNLLGALEKSTGTAKIYKDYLIEDVPFDWEDVYKIKLSGRADNMPQLKVMSLIEKDEKYPDETFNKTVAVFGGSISTPKYNSTIAQDIWDEYCGFESITNYGVPGMGFAYGSTSIPKQVEQAIANQDYDIYIFWCSTNDYRNGIPAGTVNDNPKSISDITTQCGGINYSIRRILETNPDAKIYLFTSLKFFTTSSSKYPKLGDSGYNPYSTSGAYDGKNFYYFVEKQKECAIRNGIAYLDMYSLSGINIYNYTQYIKSDKLHLTDYGYEVVGKLQAEFLYKGYSGGEDIQPNENCIISIILTSTDGLIDTYTITYTDGKTTTFKVTNGKDGADGAQGIQGEKGEDGHTPVITIQNGYWYIDGENTNVLAEGIKGETGNGISSIELTSSKGLVDTYTITFTNGTTSTFIVTNGKDGADGAQGIQGIQGEKGEDGHTPVITIQNGYWYIDGVNTNVLAEGIKGDTGNGISSIELTSSKGLVDTYTITFTNGTTSTFTVTNGKDGVDGIQGIQGEKGEDGHTPVITIQDGYWYIDGINTNVLAEGIKGETGNGISSITKTNTSGLVDTYTITYTDGTTTTFTVTNGKDGKDGEQGIQGIQGEPGKDGHTPVITIQDGYWYIDGVNTLQVAQGVKGETGNGISSIEKTSTEGLVDTYTITFTDGTTTTFTVTNGKDGEDGTQGIQGIQGVPGEDGHTPVITIQNGYWYIDGINTNVLAEGIKGETGNGISSITKTESNGLVDTYTITFTNGTTTTFTVTNGNNGEDAITPLVKINEETNMWEVSYDNGITWVSLNVNATGEKGKDADNSTVIATSIASGTSLLSTLSLLIFLLTRKKRII